MYITKDILWLGKRYKLHIIPVVAVCLVMSFLSATTMVLLGNLIYGISYYGTMETIQNALLIIGCVFICFFMRDVESRVIHVNSVEFKKEIRIDLLKSMFEAGPVVYSDERTGDISNMIWMKVDWLEYYFNEYLPRSISVIVFHLAITIILSRWIEAVSLIYLLGIVLVVLTPILFNKKAMKLGKKEWEAESEYSSDIIDRISGMATLKVLNQTEDQKAIMKKSTFNWFRATITNLKFTTFENNFMSFFIQTAKIAAIFGILAFIALTDKKVAISLAFLVIASTDDAFNMLGAWIKGAKGISGVADIIEFLRQCQEKSRSYEKHSKALMCEENKDIDLDEIILNDISFSYADKKVIKGISLKLKKGQNTAIVGPSGSGKSTLAYLICGLYEPDSGTILCKGKDGESVFTNRRRSVSAIWQDSRLFMGSVTENIVMGNHGNEELGKNAAIKANIHEKICELKNGYSTIVGDGGEAFSGGERQRILIARALVKDCSVIVFDEATAFLDKDNEILIKTSIKNELADKIILTIAHRLETVKAADYVYFIKDGKVLGEGNHEDLINENSDYRKHFGLESA